MKPWKIETMGRHVPKTMIEAGLSVFNVEDGVTWRTSDVAGRLAAADKRCWFTKRYDRIADALNRRMRSIITTTGRRGEWTLATDADPSAMIAELLESYGKDEGHAERN
jgi:hypothetical protein